MQGEPLNVSAKGAGTVMVLTMDVVGDRAADGHEARAWSDGHKPAFGEEGLDDIRKAHAAFAANHSRGFVETQNSVQTMAVDEIATRVQAGITVAAPRTKGKQAAGSGCRENFRQLVVPGGLVYVAMRDLRVAAPGKNPVRRSRAGGRARRTSGRFRGICRGSLHAHNGAKIECNFT